MITFTMGNILCRSAITLNNGVEHAPQGVRGAESALVVVDALLRARRVEQVREQGLVERGLVGVLPVLLATVAVRGVPGLLEPGVVDDALAGACCGELVEHRAGRERKEKKNGRKKNYFSFASFTEP